MTRFYWNISYDNELLEFEAESKCDAVAAAEEWLAEKCMDMDPPMRNGDVFEDIAWAISYDNNGKATGAHKVTLSYGHYHGDFAEHNTMHRGAGGSL